MMGETWKLTKREQEVLRSAMPKGTSGRPEGGGALLETDIKVQRDPWVHHSKFRGAGKKKSEKITAGTLKVTEGRAPSGLVCCRKGKNFPSSGGRKKTGGANQKYRQKEGGERGGGEPRE